jgi:hypothetical protein
MVNIERLFTHTVNVYRSSSVLLDGVTTLYSHSLAVTYAQPILLELTIPSGHASFTVTGHLNGLTTTATVVFSSGGSILKKQTDKSFDSISSIVGTTGTAASMTAKTINKSGQPYFTDSMVYANVACRMDPIGTSGGYGHPIMSPAWVVRPDNIFCYIGVTEGTILIDDKVIQTSTTDQSGLGRASTITYNVVNINSYYNRYDYLYTELVLAKAD